MNTKRVQVQSDRRCSAGDLEKLLKQLPIELLPRGVPAEARMGLGRIVYVRPLSGRGFSGVKVLRAIGSIRAASRPTQSLTFDYKRQMYDINYAA